MLKEEAFEDKTKRINELENQLITQNHQLQSFNREVDESKKKMEEAYDQAAKNEKAGDYLSNLIDSGAIELQEDGSLIVN